MRQPSIEQCHFNKDKGVHKDHELEKEYGFGNDFPY